MGKLILSAFADEYDRDLEEQLKALNSFGIEYLEIRFVGEKNISVLSEGETEAVKELLDKYGIKVNSIGSPLGKIKLDGDMDEHMETARNVFRIANTLGARYVRMFSFYPPSGRNIADCRDEVIAALTGMSDIADEYGVTLCHENEARIYGESAESCFDLINALDGRIRAVFDMGNFTLEKHDPIKAYELLKDKIEYFHIKDGFMTGEIVPAGKGEAKIYEILCDYAHSVDKDVFVTLEPHLVSFSGLKTLTETELKNPYKYDTPELAFTDAVEKFKEILKKI